MDRSRFSYYLAGSLLAGALVVTGTWLPWLRKVPVGYHDGQPVYTDEYVSGMGTGLEGWAPMFFTLVALAVCSVVIARYRDWPAEGVLVLVGALMVLVLYSHLTTIYGSGRYLAAPGVYLTLAGASLFLLVPGIDALRERSVTLRKLVPGR